MKSSKKHISLGNRGIISRKVAMKSAQLKKNKEVIDKVGGKVKLGR